jgi:hypothetical protein
MSDKPTKLERMCPEITVVVAEMGGRMRMHAGRYFVPELHRCFYDARVQGALSASAARMVLHDLGVLRDASATARAKPVADRAAAVLAMLGTVGWVAPQHYAEVRTEAMDMGTLHRAFGMWDGSVHVGGEWVGGEMRPDKAAALASLTEAVAEKWGTSK